MKVSYLVTCSSETDTLKRLVEKIYANLNLDELIILQDESNWNRDRKKYLCDITELNNDTSKIISLPIFVHPLNNDYGSHKNFGIENCSGDYIMQIDGDEFPSENIIGENLHAILESNPNVEAFVFPRINDFRGVTSEHAKQWGWRLTESPTYKRPVVNWPDYQFRCFRNDYPRISFTRRLHEKIEGYDSYVCLPPEEEYALYHDKTIDTQVKTNLRYNKMFTQAENMGHNVLK